MYAIVQARGRQIKVTPGAVVEIDGAPGERGSEFTFDQVLLVEKDAGDVVAGAPFVANARVVGVVDGEARGPKLRVFKKKRRKGFGIDGRFIFIDGRTGTTMFSQNFRESVMYDANRQTPALSSYFELMDRLIPNFLATLSSQKIKGTRILLN